MISFVVAVTRWGHAWHRVIFLSDNGASAEIMVRSDGNDLSAPMGSADTFLCLGPGFATAANTPFKKHKTWTHEGGIRTPFIVSWPAQIAPSSSFRHTPAHVIDLVPTILASAGIKPPQTQEDTASFAGKTSSPFSRKTKSITTTSGGFTMSTAPFSKMAGRPS